jgi:hypothetical protein
MRVKLVGGLGNQIFGTIAGIYLSKLFKRKLVLDLSDVSYSHSPFNIESFQLSGISVKKIKGVKRHRKLIQRLQNSFEYRFKKALGSVASILPIFYDRGYENNVNGDLAYNKVVARGYFQDFRYLQGLETELRDIFKLSSKSNKLIQLESQLLESSNIGIHIRRGDFVAAKKYHGLLSVEWYEKIFNEKKELVTADTTLWIFSNDIEWCKRHLRAITNLNWKKYIYVEDSELIDPAEVFSLFGLMDIQICANSTFSLLAARLGGNRRVIVPEILNLTGDFKALEDSLPAHWEKVRPIWED